MCRVLGATAASAGLGRPRDPRGMPVGPDCSILEGVRRAGLEVPAACADGRCGACGTRVFEGVPERRDAVLMGEERAVGETMMICVSPERTPWLVLDL